LTLPVQALSAVAIGSDPQIGAANQTGLILGSIATYVSAAPLVHLANGNADGAEASLVLRLIAPPSVAGLAFVLCAGACKHSSDIWYSLLVGALAGAAAAQIVDDGFIAVTKDGMGTS
jgi:hypothetical protein